MAGLIGIIFLIYGIKYFMYKKYREKAFVKIFDYFLSIATAGFYIFFLLIFTAVYGMERINTKIAFLLTVISLLLLIVKFLFITTNSIKYTLIIDIFYFIILILFILVG